MERIAQRDIRAILGVLEQLDGTRDLDVFPSQVLSLLQTLIPSDVITFNEVNPPRSRVAVVVDPVGSLPSDGEQRFEPHIREHPLINHYQQTDDGRAVMLSDFLSQRQFHALGLYQEFFRAVGLEHQLAVTLPSPAPLVVGIAFNRASRDFAERDRLLLNLLRPHLVHGYRQAMASRRIRQALDAMERGMEVGGVAVVVLSPTGHPPLMTAQARRWLDIYFSRSEQRINHLPADLAAWISNHRRGGTNDELTQPADCLILERDGGELAVRFVPEADGQPAILVLEERQVDSASALLTQREAAVLQLVAEGRTNREIATALAISERTAEKHLERIFAKLRVDTRTAAAAWAYRNRRSARTWDSWRIDWPLAGEV